MARAKASPAKEASKKSKPKAAAKPKAKSAPKSSKATTTKSASKSTPKSATTAKPASKSTTTAKSASKSTATAKSASKSTPKATSASKSKVAPKAAPKSKAAAKPLTKPKAVAKPKPKARATKTKAADNGLNGNGHDVSTGAVTRPAPPMGSGATIAGGGGEVVRILDSDDPIAALREYLDDIGGGATVQQGQVALGSAQLMLLPIAREHRGGDEVKELLDLVLGRWTTFPDRTGFHAQEFLRNAFAAVGADRERIARLTALVPVDASPELRFNVACALAVAGERDSMLRAIEVALAAGASATAFRTDDDFAEYQDDAAFQAVLDRAAAPAIPVDIGPHVPIVRASLDTAIKTLREFGEVAKLEPPATLDAVLSAERAGKLQLPNDYRALLTICDGLTLWDHAFFGTVDYKNATELAKSAKRYLEQSARYGRTGIDECVPLANWGQPNDWLLYDPFGHVRGGAPGYVLMLNADECPLDGLAHALDRFERIARDVLGTN